MGTESIHWVEKHSPKGIELLPVPQLYWEVMGKIPGFVPLTHTSSLIRSLYGVLRIPVEPRLSQGKCW